MDAEHSGATQWATDAAERICGLDGIAPHVRVNGDARYMIAVLARIIDSEHNDQHTCLQHRVAGKGGG